MNGQESILDATEWIEEAEAQMRDIRSHVKVALVSPVLGSDDTGVYINLTTLEDLTLCVRLSPQGFKVVAEKHDSLEGSERWSGSYETPYALLSAVSPGFHTSFGSALCESLAKLEQAS